MAVVVPEQPVGVAVLVRHEQIEIAVAVDVEPDRADGLARIADARLDGDVGEAAAVVAKQPVRLVAKGHEEIEVAVVVVVDPRDLTRDAGQVHAERGRDVGEVTAVAVVAIELVGRAAHEADVEIEVAVAVEVAPRRGAGLDVVGQADRGRDILEAPVILAIETIRPAAKADELVEIAVVVEVGPRVRLPAGHAEQLRLNQLEARRRVGGRGGREGEARGRQRDAQADHSPADDVTLRSSLIRDGALPAERLVWHGEREGSTPASPPSTARRRRSPSRPDRRG